MKKLIKSLARNLGHKKAKKSNTRDRFDSAFQNAFMSLLSCKEKIRIVQIGANDGRLNDPIYDLMKEFASRTEALLIEPQSDLIPFLTENYKFHPHCQIYNGAIGPEGTLRLFSIDPKFWPQLKAPQDPSWPAYRAPTGVTSTNRAIVHAWLAKNLAARSLIDQAIRESTVPSTPLLPLLNQLSFPTRIDVLQIDTEGFDDQVIYNCSITVTRPRIIHFESTHLEPDQYEKLAANLRAAKYVLSRQGHNSLAVLVKYESGERLG